MVRKSRGIVRERGKGRERVVPGDKVAGERVGSKRHVSNREGLQIGKRDGKVFNENPRGGRGR